MSKIITLPPSGERLLSVNRSGGLVDVTAEVYGPIRKAWGAVGDPSDASAIAKARELAKSGEVVTTADNLVAIDLEAPAKNLYPVLTPIRNALPRSTKGTGAGLGPQWRAVTSIAGNASLPISPWVREGQRAALMNITTEDKSASYVTIGDETSVTFEAQAAASGFEDEYSMSAMRLLQNVMIREEHALLGGNRSVALGTPATPTLSTATTGGTITNATYLVYVMALTYEGYQNWLGLGGAITVGPPRQVTLTGADGQSYVINGGSSKSSASASQATTGSTSTLSASTTAIEGAVAYMWFVGTSGNEKLEAVTLINSVKLTALAGTGYAYSSVASPSSDYSYNNGTGGNNAPAFDGLLYAAWGGTGTITTALATGTPGTGSTLTASGDGGIDEIDTILASLWSTYRVSPEVIYVNAQEMKNIKAKIFGGTANGNLRYTVNVNPAGAMQAGIAAIEYVSIYAMAANGTPTIPIRIHPTLTPGTMLFWTNNLPAQYQAANVPLVASVQCRRDYYQIPWVQTTRRQETGVYAEEVLKVYFPQALAILTNIADG